MPPKIASIIFISFIIYLFYLDYKKKDRPSNALWLPIIWMFLAGSRYFSSWLNLSSPLTTMEAYQEGSPIDRIVFASLIAAGIFVLNKRMINLKLFVSENKWVFLYFLYCAISITWSDYPFVSFKRYVKEIGSFVMVLLILTEKQSYEACGIILRRLAFIMLPLSVLFIRYYPDLGRAYHQGIPMVTGVAHQKNHLGQICMLSGVYFLWNILYSPKSDEKLGKADYIAYSILVAMGFWLLYKAQSATSVACFTVSTGLLLACRMHFLSRKPNKIYIFGVSAILIFMLLETTTNLNEFIFQLLGRDASLTDRVPVWNLVQTYVKNPVFGEGYQSFWTGDRMASIWNALEGARITQAHNGYLETYLNLGYIGVSLIIVMVLAGMLKVRRHLQMDYPSAVLRLCFITIALLYNYTEASFYAITNIWLLLIFAIIDIPQKGIKLWQSTA